MLDANGIDHGEGNLERQSHCGKRHTETVEGNTYFPEASLKREYFRPQQHHLDLSVEGAGALFEPAD